MDLTEFQPFDYVSIGFHVVQNSFYLVLLVYIDIISLFSELFFVELPYYLVYMGFYWFFMSLFFLPRFFVDVRYYLVCIELYGFQNLIYRVLRANH